MKTLRAQNTQLLAEAVEREAWNQYLERRRKDLANAVSKMKCVLPGHSSKNRLCDRCNALYPDYVVEPIKPEDNTGSRILALARAAVKRDKTLMPALKASMSDDAYAYQDLEEFSKADDDLDAAVEALTPSDLKLLGVE